MSQFSEPSTPMAVTESAKPSMAMTAARDLLKVAGAALVTRGVIGQEWVEPIVGSVLVAVPMIWSQIVTVWRHRQLVVAADAAPTYVANVIRK